MQVYVRAVGGCCKAGVYWGGGEIPVICVYEYIIGVEHCPMSLVHVGVCRNFDIHSGVYRFVGEHHLVERYVAYFYCGVARYVPFPYLAIGIKGYARIFVVAL